MLDGVDCADETVLPVACRSDRPFDLRRNREIKRLCPDLGLREGFGKFHVGSIVVGTIIAHIPIDPFANSHRRELDRQTAMIFEHSLLDVPVDGDLLLTERVGVIIRGGPPKECRPFSGWNATTS